MKKICILFLLACFVPGLSGQVIKEIKSKHHSIAPYFIVEPKDEILGVMVLLPGGSLNPESIFPETKLHNVAYLHNIMVVALDYGKTTIYLTDSVLHKMNMVLMEVMENYKIPRDKFVIGGYSAGGITALCYTVYCKQYPEKAVIDPQAVFTADSPVDIAEVWHTLNRELQKNYSETAMTEARYFLPQIEKDMKGTPESNPEGYISHSPYSHSQKDGGNAKYLLNTPVRLYHDPDIVWQLQNRRRDLFDMNEPMASAMINYLLLNGNDKAEFVVSDRPGMRSRGERHPHSWSIIEEVDCVIWLKECLGIE